MSNHEHDSFDIHALRRSLRRWRLTTTTLACAIVATVGVGMAQHSGEPTVVGFGVSDQPSGRIDDTFYRLLSDGTIEELDTSTAEPSWGPAQGLSRIRD
ncbi:MAG: hypothetical protein ACF8QF_02550 [Phycisphaerales bacterium]